MSDSGSNRYPHSSITEMALAHTHEVGTAETVETEMSLLNLMRMAGKLGFHQNAAVDVILGSEDLYLEDEQRAMMGWLLFSQLSQTPIPKQHGDIPMEAVALMFVLSYKNTFLDYISVLQHEGETAANRFLNQRWGEFYYTVPFPRWLIEAL